MRQKDEEKYIVLFDGVCNFCNGAVNFIIDRDRKGRFRFAALQSEAGRRIAREFNLRDVDGEPSTIYLIEGSRAFDRSGAALRIAGKLTGVWPILTGVLAIPSPLRDAVYGLFARNRYRWFGKSEACRVPEPSLQKRFLDLVDIDAASEDGSLHSDQP